MSASALRPNTSATGNIGFFKIVSEAAIAAGVRRIEAVTGEAAETLVAGLQETIRSTRAFFNNVPDLKGAIEKMVEENAAFKKEIENFVVEKAKQFADKLIASASEVGGIKLIKFSHSVDPAMARIAAANLQKSISEDVVIAGAYEWDGKPQLLLLYSNSLVAKGRNAGKDIREAAKLIQGGGGGQPGLATAGGKDTAGLAAALEKLVEIACE